MVDPEEITGTTTPTDRIDDRRAMSAQAEEERRKHNINPDDTDTTGGAGGVGLPERALNQSVGTSPIDELRRDVARLEGKVDALLSALEVEVDDGDP